MHRLVGVVVVAALTSGAPAHGQVIGGRTIRVSSEPLSSQVFGYSNVTETFSGDLVVAWNDYRDGVRQAFAQRLDPWGHRLGDELAIGVPTEFASRLALAPISTGGFVAVWTRPDGTVRGHCFDSNGLPTPQGVFTIGSGYRPDVAGGAFTFVVAWTELDGGGQVFARQFSGSTCAPSGAAMIVSPTSATGPLAQVSVATGNNGRFVVAWENPDGDVGGTFARVYAVDGTPVGPGFRANADITGDQQGPDTSMDWDGSFVVVWDAIRGVYARRFDRAGVPLGLEVLVSDPTTLVRSARVVHLYDSKFVVAWYEAGPPPDLLVNLRHFDAAGVAGPIILGAVGHFPTQGFSLTSEGYDGSAVVTWNRRDGPQEEIALRRFAPLAAESMAVDGNGIFEPGEHVIVRPTWRNGTGAPITLGARAVNFTGPYSPGVSYGLLDSDASYGTLGSGASASCSVTGDCYEVSAFSPARPALHWDTRLEERPEWSFGVTTHRWPVHVGASFSDVPLSSPFYPFTEAILHAGVTAGCSATGYCPAARVTREQVAVFALRSRHDGYRPWACTGSLRAFADVPATSAYCAWIEDLARRNVVSGCGNGSYCPNAAVTRAEMALFVLATKEGPGYVPPACGTPLFTDVPASSPFCRWIEELARRGVVAGCGGASYCPEAPVLREQMSVFLARAFGLSLSLP